MKPKALRAKPVARRGPSPAIDWMGIAETCRRRPQTWFEVAEFVKSTNAVWRIRTGANPAFRDGKWDAATSTEDGKRVLYVCYLGSEE